MTEEPEDIATLRLYLHELRVEHRDVDELMLRRLKKRRLLLKDRIALLEHMIKPDAPRMK